MPERVCGAVDRFLSILGRKRHELVFMLVTMANPAVHLIALVVSMKHLSARELGIISTAAMIPSYAAFLQLGIFSGLLRNLPYFLGDGQEEKAHELARSSNGFATALALATSICMLAVAWFGSARGSDSLVTLALTTIAFALFAAPVNTHADVVLRGHGHFGRLALAIAGTQAVSLASIALIPWLGATGAALRVAIAATGLVAFRWTAGGYRLSLRMRWSDCRELARIGFPLMLSGALFSLLAVTDRTAVALMLNAEQVGYLALAGMIMQGLQVIPQSLSLVVFPTMARDFGRHRLLSRLRRHAVINLVFNLVTVVPVAVTLYFLIGEIVVRFFPRYLPGLGAAKVTCLASCFWVSLGVGSVFGVSGRIMPYLLALVAAILVVFAGSLIAIRLGYGIVGAAWARLTGTALLSLFTIGRAFWIMRNPDRT